MADADVADMPRRLDQHRAGVAHRVGLLEVDVAHQRREHEQPSRTSIVRSPAPATSTSNVGAASPSIIIGTRLWPPASTWASSSPRSTSPRRPPTSPRAGIRTARCTCPTRRRARRGDPAPPAIGRDRDRALNHGVGLGLALPSVGDDEDFGNGKGGLRHCSRISIAIRNAFRRSLLSRFSHQGLLVPDRCVDPS